MRPLLALVLLTGALAGREPGTLEVAVDPGAELQLFREVQPGQPHLMVHDCPEDLAGLLEDRTTEGFLEIDVTGVGNQSWYLRFQLSRPSLVLDATLKDGALRLSTSPRQERAAPLPVEALTVERLLAGEDLPQAGPAPAMPMVFLHGEALLPSMDPSSYQPLLPVFAPGVSPGSWWAIDRARETYLEGGSTREQAEAVYALGWNYLELGFAREARYYFDLLPAYDHAFDPTVIALTRARVAMRLGDWEGARLHLIEGWERGASPEQVLESLALVSLATSSPPPTATAHALLGASGRPEAWLLAAELLQRANHFDRSIAVLQGLEPRVQEELRSAVALRLGDALLATGDSDGAMRAYQRAPEEQVRLRRLHADLLELPSTSWPQVIPPLRDLARADSAEGAEALYLLAQVNILFGETTSAMEDLKELEERFPATFARSDAGRRQLDLYFESLVSLHEQLRWVDIASLHRQTWSRELLNLTTDHRPLLLVADAFEAMGLPEEARRVLGDAFYVLSTHEGEDPTLVFRLAQLYADAGRSAEALETLEYLEQHELPAGFRGRQALLRGEILAVQGDDAGALASYRTAASFSDTRDQAQIALALRDAEAGRCRQAIPSLQRLLMPTRKLSRVSDPLPFLALARCLMSEGREAEAAAVAREAAGRIEQPEDARHAAYIGVGPGEEGSPAATMSRQALLSERDIWALLGQEELEAAAFSKEVEARRDD